MQSQSADDAMAEYYIRAEHGEAGVRFYRARKRQAFSQALADARELWAVRVLDAYDARFDTESVAVKHGDGSYRVLATTPDDDFRRELGPFAKTADAARIAAADAVWSELPDEDQKRIGTRP